METHTEPFSDLELALFLAKHIEDPCGVQVGNEYHNIRGFYLREAERVLPKLRDDIAIEILNRKIEKYSNELLQ